MKVDAVRTSAEPNGRRSRRSGGCPRTILKTSISKNSENEDENVVDVLRRPEAVDISCIAIANSSGYQKIHIRFLTICHSAEIITFDAR